MATVTQNVFSEELISYLNGLQEVVDAKAKLDTYSTDGVVYFNVTLTDTMKTALYERLGLDVSGISTVPMRWIKGDTAPHIDSGASDFTTTYLMYLNDCPGEFIVDDASYPIAHNTAFVFDEGISHKTLHTEYVPRLLLGPMNEKGMSVGLIVLTYTIVSATTNRATLNFSQLDIGFAQADVYNVFLNNISAGITASGILNTQIIGGGTYTLTWNQFINGTNFSVNTGDVFNLTLQNTTRSGAVTYPANYVNFGVGATVTAAPCFTADSQLLTPTGYVKASNIKTGDVLVTSDGRAVPIKAYMNTFKATKDSAPYLIPKNSLARNVPAADMRLSPWHAISLGNGLWQKPQTAAELNPGILTQYDIGNNVEYYHFEAPNYYTDNFICEGTVVESFGSKQVSEKEKPYTWSAKHQAYTRNEPAKAKKPAAM